MLFRLVSPVQRKGSRNVQLAKRIPSDLRERAAGRQVAIPIGGSVKLVTITPGTQSFRVSLETSDPKTAKIRQQGLGPSLKARD